MLQILGIIFLLIIGKFIYDTFLTNNTAETKEWYKKHYPEENYRLDRNEGLDFNVKPKTNINDRQRSIYEIAKNMNTTPELAQEKYIEQLKSKINSHDEKIYFFKTIRKKKIEEAEKEGIDPDDSISSILEKWALEYLNSVDFKIKINNEMERNGIWDGRYYSTEIEVSIRQIISAEKLLSLSKNDIVREDDFISSVYTKFMKIKHKVDIQIDNIRKINEASCDEFYIFDVYLTHEDPTVPTYLENEGKKFLIGCNNWMDLFNGDEDNYENWLESQ